MTQHKFAEALKNLPTKPGVYLYKNAAGKVIYVGKAVNLRARVRSYFHQSAQHTPKIRQLVEEIADIEFIVAGSELEALLLENNLIKKHQPRYNVRLKDDKRYPYIKVHWQDPFPRVTTTRRILDDGAVYAQPFSEGGAAAAGAVAFATSAKPVEGGWIVSGKKIFASLSGHANYYGALCTEIHEGEKPSRRNTVYLAIPADAKGVSVVGDWDPLGMRGTVSRTLIFEDVFVGHEAALMPRGVYFQAAVRWPHMFTTLSPSYMGLAQAAYDFTVRYLRGEQPGAGPVKRRMYPTKQIAVAQMRITLEQTKALWFQTMREARANPTKDQLLRLWAAHYTIMENANELAQLAIRTCGGQSMLKSLPLERIYRDSRCGSLMLPWTAEICLDRIGRAALYEDGETDEP